MEYLDVWVEVRMQVREESLLDDSPPQRILLKIKIYHSLKVLDIYIYVVQQTRLAFLSPLCLFGVHFGLSVGATYPIIDGLRSTMSQIIPEPVPVMELI